MKIAHINIGSNIGDSRSAIERAVAAVYKLSPPAGRPAFPVDLWPRRSSVVESEPWGFDSPNKFLNIGVEILTDLSPLELLDRLQAIERSISPLSHRNPDGSYRDRLIDLDLIFLLPLPLPLPPSSPCPLPSPPLLSHPTSGSVPTLNREAVAARAMPGSAPSEAPSKANPKEGALLGTSPLENSIRFCHPRLTLPHPRAAEREFVMAPIRELWQF